MIFPNLVAFDLTRILLIAIVGLTIAGVNNMNPNFATNCKKIDKHNPLHPLSTEAKRAVAVIEGIITKDEGGRGMASLVVPGDLEEAAMIFARLKQKCDGNSNKDENDIHHPHVLILSGFPCCVDKNPPTETDGPPGALAIARAAVLMGYKVTIVTDDCNEKVFSAACADKQSWATHMRGDVDQQAQIHMDLTLKCFPSENKMSSDDYMDLYSLADDCDLVIACERAGPGKDGKCYTMRGIDMTSAGLIAPLHLIVDKIRDCTAASTPFLAIGDGGNELGMGKMLDAILSNPKISNANQIAAVGVADRLIAASVSNWGAYALVGAAACVQISDISKLPSSSSRSRFMVATSQFLPSSAEENDLLDRCVSVGCRDGVSGLMEATVDGMPLETSLTCLEAIRFEVAAVACNVTNI